MTKTDQRGVTTCTVSPSEVSAGRGLGSDDERVTPDVEGVSAALSARVVSRAWGSRRG